LPPLGLVSGATISGGGTSTWSVRRTGPSDAKAETLYTSERELNHLVKAGDSLFFQRDETAEKPLPPHAKKPIFEERTWSLYSLAASGGTPSLRAASVSPTAIATDGANVYYTATVEAKPDPHFPKTALFRLPAGPTGSPEVVDEWVIESNFGASYGGDSFVLYIHAWGKVSQAGIPSDLTRLLYLGKRAQGRGRRVCVAEGSNAHAFAVVGSTLPYASQPSDGSGAQGIVKYVLP